MGTLLIPALRERQADVWELITLLTLQTAGCIRVEGDRGKNIWEKGAAVRVMLVWSQGSPLLNRSMEIPEGLPSGLVVLCSFGCALSDWGGELLH